MGHCLWVCLNKAVYPEKGEVQHKERVMKRKWHWKEKDVERQGQLLERSERE